MGRFIVMDIVFYAGSLNYDQGSGNYQELKKITKWDGKQYTFVSRYALRYSLLETGKRLGLWQVAGAKELLPEKNQQVIQPSEDLLLSGRILEYPEFDLFGYLITSTQPQNFREAPVKISHAISLTPFNYDALFNANIGLANRIRKHQGEMSPNPFTSEEHLTFYQYTVVIDLEGIGSIEVYLAKQYRKSGKTANISLFNVEKSENAFNFHIKYKNLHEVKFSVPIDCGYKLEEILLPFEKENEEISICKELEGMTKYNKDLAVVILKYSYSNTKERVEKLIQATLNLHRSIKARDEDLSPKLFILGLYKDVPYKTYKDKIILKDEYTEEEYDEIITEEKDGKIVRKVIHKVSRSKKPVFEIVDGEFEEMTLDEVADKVKTLIENSNSEGFQRLYLAHTPEIEVKGKVKKSNGAGNSG